MGEPMTMATFRLAAALGLTALLAGGCATTKGSVNESFGSNPEQAPPRRVLLVEPDIRLHEVSAGGVVEQIDEWSRQASQNAVTSLQDAVREPNLFELVAAPNLTEADKAALDQHAALYALVGGSAHGAQASPYGAWRQRAATFDYTLGPGLQGVAEHTHMDAVLFLVGTDYISSAGRRAAMVFGILAAAFTGVVIAPAGSPTFMSVGLVDMRTGALIWYATDIRGGSSDLRDAGVMKELIDGMVQTYPYGAKPADAGKTK
jgi:hypothetical protein